MVLSERNHLLSIYHAQQTRIMPNHRVFIQRQMVRRQIDIVLQQKSHTLTKHPRQRFFLSPQKPVMHDYQIRSGRLSLAKQFQGCRNAKCYLTDLRFARHLQPIMAGIYNIFTI